MRYNSSTLSEIHMVSSDPNDEPSFDRNAEYTLKGMGLIVKI